MSRVGVGVSAREHGAAPEVQDGLPELVLDVHFEHGHAGRRSTRLLRVLPQRPDRRRRAQGVADVDRALEHQAAVEVLVRLRQAEALRVGPGGPVEVAVAGQGAIAPPQSSHLAGGVGLAEARATIPFVRINAGFKLGIEEGINALNNLVYLGLGEQIFQDEIAL